MQKNYPVVWKNPDATPKLCFVGCPHLSLQQLVDWTENVEKELKNNGKKKVAIPTVFTAAPKVLEAFEKTEYAARLKATGAKFAPVQGKNITALFYYKSALKRMIATMLIPIAMKKHRNIEPSMLQDLKKNKPCEIDAINGIICRFGRKYCVKTPFNDKIVEIIKSCEKGELRPDIKNLDLFKELL